MEAIKDFFGYGPVDPNAPIPPPREPEHKIPHDMLTFITFKCFDSCIGDFNDKNLVGEERYCLKACADSLRTQTVAYQSTQEFRGFSKNNTSPLAIPTMGSFTATLPTPMKLI